mgnify:CR=1 FL=1
MAGGTGATVDLHWDDSHSAIVGEGNLPGFENQVFSYRQEISGESLIKTYTLGDQSWVVIWKKGISDFLIYKSDQKLK